MDFGGRSGRVRRQRTQACHTFLLACACAVPNNEVVASNESVLTPMQLSVVLSSALFVDLCRSVACLSGVVLSCVLRATCWSTFCHANEEPLSIIESLCICS